MPESRIIALCAIFLSVPALLLTGLRAENKRAPLSVADLARSARKIAIKVPGGHLLGAATDGAYTYAMSDGVPAPKLVVAPGGERYLGYNDQNSEARLVALDADWRVVREIAHARGKRLEDLTAGRDGIALLLTEFDAEQKQNYVARKFHTAHLAKYDARGRLLFQKRIVGTREYTKEGDQGIMDSFATFSLACDADSYATYFTTYRRWGDGVVHQSEYLALFDRAKGTQLMAENDRSPLGWTWNVSHSFRPRFVHDGEEFVMATVGDAYPRAFIVHFFPERSRETVIPVPKAQPGETYQYVPVSTGDLYGSGGRSWVVFDSAVGKGDYDVGLVRVNGRTVSKPVWLTSSSRARERIPRIAPFGNEGLLVLWGVDGGAARDKWFPKTGQIQLQATIVDLEGRTLAPVANVGAPGQFVMRGAARTFVLPDDQVGWLNDLSGLPDQVEVVLLPGPDGPAAEEEGEDSGANEEESEDNGDEIVDVTIDPSLSRDLLRAIYDGREGDALALLRRGADPNAAYESWTALLYAAYFGRIGVVRALIRRNANPNAQVSGWTALRLAEVRGHTEIVAALRPITTVSARALGREAVPAALLEGRPTPALRTRASGLRSAPGGERVLDPDEALGAPMR